MNTAKRSMEVIAIHWDEWSWSQCRVKDAAGEHWSHTRRHLVAVTDPGVWGCVGGGEAGVLEPVMNHSGRSAHPVGAFCT